MNGELSLMDVMGLAGVVGLAALAGFLISSLINPSPRLLSCCVGGIMGIVLGTIGFEFVPALKITPANALPVLGTAVGGFIAAVIAHALARRGLPERHTFQELAIGSFVLTVVIDDVVEGLTLGFASALSTGLAFFSAASFIAKNILEGFTEATVLRWEGSRKERIWAAGGAAAVAVVPAAVMAASLRANTGPGDSSGTLVFAAATGALMYVSVFALARNLEWNGLQKLCAVIGFVATGIIAVLV